MARRFSLSLHATAVALHRALPRLLRRPAEASYSLVRRCTRTVVAPLSFTVKTGHWRSCLSELPVDRDGAPLPWYTYPLIDFLQEQDLTGYRVLEWGAGYSTLWWARRGAEVLAFESDRAWWERLRPMLPRNARVEPIRPDLVDLVLPHEQYDVIVIDGAQRTPWLRYSLDLLSPTGAIIADDLEDPRLWPPDGAHAIARFLAAGLIRVDFYGQGPIDPRYRCTSMFLRESCPFLRNRRPPQIEGNRR
jgi:hypothetical protein